MSYFAGIDLGGTKIAGVILKAPTGEMVSQTRVPTAAHLGPDSVLERIAELVRSMCREIEHDPATLAGIGCGMPAVIDFDQGRTLLMPNLPGNWFEKPVTRILNESLGCSVSLINDARAFTLAEANLGSGRGARNVVCFTVGTGIGGGITLNGELYLGLESKAGEFGHQTVDPNGPLCGCGNHGCLEALASGPAITAQAVRAMLQGMSTKISALAEQDTTRVSPEIIMRAAEQVDPVARDILWRAGNYLGIGIANVVTLLCPERVIVGGGVTRLGNWILEPARAAVRERCHTAPLDKISIVLAGLGDESGAIGAAIWAMQRERAFNIGSA